MGAEMSAFFSSLKALAYFSVKINSKSFINRFVRGLAICEKFLMNLQ
jgi:hypothetical protein